MVKMGGDEELLKEVVAAFLDAWEATVGAVDAAMRLGDCKALRRAAHTLKGSVATFSTGPLYETALELEHCGRDERLESAQHAYRRLRVEIEQLLPELRKLCAQTVTG
jgi:HPt (histidine-containing phosphotransfer) domain-containing protein